MLRYLLPANNLWLHLTTSTDSRLKASPLAKAIAKDKGIDLAKVNGSGDDGRIVKKDLENISSTPAAAVPAPKVYTGTRVIQ
jgi:pyruvate dehydrogenase E2 component (dihydrolipoamide acetyltransferase)